MDPAGKANLLAQQIRAKGQLADRVDHVEEFQQHVPVMSEFFLVRTRWVYKIIMKLKDGKASGPDGFPIRFFKECGREMALVVALLVRFLLRNRRWPDIWRHHRVHPLFKRGAVSNPGNYRGVHLTNIISKLVERCVARALTPFFDRIGAFGVDQWAFRKKRSCRDLVTLLVCRWLYSGGFRLSCMGFWMLV